MEFKIIFTDYIQRKDYNKTSLHKAVEKGNKNIIHLLLKHPKIKPKLLDSIFNCF